MVGHTTKEIVAATAARVDVPIDHNKLAKLTAAFAELSTRKQVWLLQRFPHSDSDREATRKLNDPEVTERMVRDWKEKDINFVTCYNLLKSGLVDWEKHLAVTIESGNALLAAIENRKILSQAWDTLSARAASAKGVAINQTLSRVLSGVSSDRTPVKNIEDLAPEDSA